MTAVTPDFSGFASQKVAVLASGGLDSAILLADAARVAAAVQPVYIRSGLYWEAAELAHLEKFLGAIAPLHPALQPLIILDQPVGDLYGAHWSITGKHVPDAATPDDAVFLPGRNVLLIAKVLLWCHLHGIKQLALGVLGSNPFPDASPTFFENMAAVVGQSVQDSLRIVRPYGRLHKADVMRRGAGLPLELSFSCIQPINGQHCGLCNKCEERKQAFAAVRWVDPTIDHRE